MADRLTIACIGLGGMLNHLLTKFTTSPEVDVVALCDVDENQILATQKRFEEALSGARTYRDYRALFDKEKALDGVVVATPDHWHTILCKAAFEAGLHVYCEKPLTNSIAEARELRELSKRANVVTQTGNNGSAADNFRRAYELVDAGLFGQISEVHAWHPKHGWPCGIDRPAGADPTPKGLDWDSWLGPAPARPYKAEIYHPFNWRGWYDFGSGSLGDFCCHMFNLPLRALKLGYPTRIEASGADMGKESFPSSCTVKLHFPARPGMAPVTIFFYAGQDTPPAHVAEGVVDPDDNSREHGCVMVGEKGSLSIGLWNEDGNMKMRGEKAYRSINEHEEALPVGISLPRVKSQVREWIDACKGGPKAWSPFELGGHLTEIGLAGVLALRLGGDIDWDGEAMKAPGHPEADALIRPSRRDEQHP
jgi:predicted dehydrogenase